jgi:hypothetical protein
LSSNTAYGGTGTDNTVFESIETTKDSLGNNTLTANGIITPNTAGTSWIYSVFDIATQTSTSFSRFNYNITTVYTNSTPVSCQTIAFGHVVPAARSLILTPSAGTIFGQWNITGY